MTTSLLERLADPGFTPSVKLLGSLLELVGNDEAAAERAVLKIEAQYAAKVAKGTAEAVRASSAPARARLTKLAGRLVRDERDPEGLLKAWLFEALEHADDTKAVRAAARALGNIEGSRAALEKALGRYKDGPVFEAISEAVAKQGGQAQGGRAAIIAQREAGRGKTEQSIDLGRTAARPLRIWFHCRSGLEEIVKAELNFPKAALVGPGVIEATLRGPLREATSIRTAMHVGFPLDAFSRSADLANDIVRGLRSGLDIFETFGGNRFRLSFKKGGHRRSVAWRVAELVQKELPQLVNDPRESSWEVVVDEVGDAISLELVPRFEDDRFQYRTDLVPAASHPTIAAALARVAPRYDDDVVWDPFVGCGAELVERARLGPYDRLLGTDLDPRAVQAARTNTRGIERVTIERGDATSASPTNVSLVITNPPMGRRIARGEHSKLLETFVEHVAAVLRPGGTLVWLVPNPGPIHRVAERSGFSVRQAVSVDMGGFSAELASYALSRKPR